MEEALVAAGVAVDTNVTVAGTVLADVLRLEPGAGGVRDLPGFADGAFWIMDPAAAAVADFTLAGEGTRVLDACAAPGGKSFRMVAAGAEVICVDRSPERLELLRSSAERLGFDLEIGRHDWTSGPLDGLEPVDVVLVDAPCTGLGTLRRHPEIRWRRVEEDIAAAAEVELAIVRNAANHVTRGGVLVYAVCSAEPEEGPDVVAALLKECPDFKLEAEFQTAPPQGDYDGHYAARLRRSSR
jgi:16S rRNA (cytosine967-C5)-methyltransferase